MKKIALVLCVALFVLAACASTQKKQREWNESYETRIQCGTYGVYPVELVFDRYDNKIVLRIVYPPSKVVGFGQESLNFLKYEVVRLVHNRTTKLGKTGYTFTFAGGYPDWGPYESHMITYWTDSLTFAHHASIEGKRITAWGVDKKPGYWPYQF